MKVKSRKVDRMLEHLLIKTEDRKVLKPLIESAIENEKKMVLLGLERTRAHLEAFEKKHGSTVFDGKSNTK